MMNPNRFLALLLSWIYCATLAHADTTRTGTVDSPHGSLNMECQKCHTTENWRFLRTDFVFDHSRTAFPLTGRHETVTCRECHTSLVFSDAGLECMSCHKDIHQGQFALECSQCHTPKRWDNTAEMYANHERTRFPLTGVHGQLDCQACHSKGQYADLPVECQGCHMRTYERTSNPAHAAAGFSVQCETCHRLNAANWTASFEHIASFPLSQAHNIRDCLRCHANQVYTGLSSECFSCHEADFTTAQNPGHVTSHLPQDCAQCHSIVGWRPARFDHSLSSFPLTGKHTMVSCADCHIGGQFTGTTAVCYDCHRAPFEEVLDPNHVVGQFSQTCTECHTTDAWKPSTFDHSLTQFPLTGKHTTAICLDCHINGQYQGTSTACYDCHQANYASAQNPDHAAAQIPHDCQPCHTTDLWRPSTFNHGLTHFALTGSHTTVACQNCHINGQYQGTSTACYDCHQSNYASAQNPDHAAAQIPHDCQPCHTTDLWRPSTFNHGLTHFALTGSHTTVACQNCHINGQYQGTSTACYDCHQQSYASAQNPDHAAAQIPHDCQPCHNTDLWRPSTFNHSQTQFALTGAHTSALCQQCHINGQFAGTSTQCYDCHQQDYQNATNPNHVQGQFPHNCSVCHSTTVWDPAAIDHNLTQFPLTGRHASVACELCHVNGQYSNTPTDCWSCHRAAYEGVSDPDHVAGQYNHICTECHNTNNWNDVVFPHNQTAFPLTGAHVSVVCALCHVNGQFSGTPTDCYFCHEADYNGTNNPNHSAAGFPHECMTCHTTFNWNSQFNHDGLYFPIYSGRHRGEWDQCSDCHTNPTDYAVFSCIICHEHNCTSMANEHDEVTGFVCESNACYTCHHDGDGIAPTRRIKDPVRR